jgi:hypothetical protein
VIGAQYEEPAFFHWWTYGVVGSGARGEGRKMPQWKLLILRSVRDNYRGEYGRHDNEQEESSRDYRDWIVEERLHQRLAPNSDDRVHSTL